MTFIDENGAGRASPKTDKAYWDRGWSSAELPTPIDPRLGGLNNYVNRRLHGYFAHALAGMETQGKRLLEIGCASSAWLPYFSREFGFRVSGIDYSELGCAKEQEILSRAGVDGDIVRADLFEPPDALLGAFDVVLTMGLVEHFDDTAACLAACIRFLKPGGLVITLIPNLGGLPGWLQRHLDRAVYDAHVPLDAARLKAAHRQVGLDVKSCGYFLTISLGALNTPARVGAWYYPVLPRLQSWVSKAFWILEKAGLGLPPSRFASPYVICVAKGVA